MSGNHPYRRAGAVIVAGTVVWFVGISPVSRVYITPDNAARLRMLTASQRSWIAGQHLTAVGTVAVPVGFAYRRGSNTPFLTYSALHVVALAALGGSLLSLPVQRWIGVTAAASAPVYGAILVAKKDIPPFFFYLVEGLTGAYLMTWEESEADKPRAA
ncbi:hypothetical protein LN996_01945 [Arthrobacter sp. AK01]|uniref:hypothetical protein n=1 Tax=Micrococcaceae TaxID=1268 RepID=UPI001E5D27B6|nr:MULTISPECIES: hypothetical protein [Micrococcaceae]MCD4849566.1 hypothetical protein [Arthrobacter sp. AK01]MCP1411048.1 hypothetical protein [Paenarthrobacter sp. A20]